MKKIKDISIFIEVFNAIKDLIKLKQFERPACKGMFCRILDVACYTWTEIKLSKQDEKVTNELFSLLIETGEKFFEDLKLERIENEKN